ncbi:MAG: response regulator [Desulfobacterales bacterium]|nr:response regulator [Desulfobacterales bacterium]
MLTNISIYTLPPALTLLTSLILGVTSIWKGKLKPENALFSLVCFCWAAAPASLVLHGFVDSEARILRLDRILHFFFVYTPSFMMLFFHKIIGVKRTRLTAGAFVLSFLISLATQSDYYFSGIYTYHWGTIAKGGAAFHVFVLYSAFLMGYVLISLARNLRQEKNRIERLKKKYIFYSFLVSGVLMMGDCPATMGVDFYPAGNFMFIPLTIMAYGVLKHRLMNIQSAFLLILFKVATCSLIIAPNYLLFTFAEPYFPGVGAPFQLLALGLWFWVNYLCFTSVQPVLDRLFYRSKHNLKRIENRFTGNVLSLKSLANLIDEFEKVVNTALTVESRGVFIHAEEQGVFERADGARLSLAPGLARWLLDADDLIQRSMAATSRMAPDVKEGLMTLFDAAGAEYATPMIRNDELIALVFLSEKSYPREMEEEEIEFIRKITASFAVAVSNSLLFQKISDLKDRLEERTIELTREIEGRIQAEKERFKSEAKYRIVAENVSDVIWTLDPETLTFPFVSPSVERFSGWTPEEVKEKTMAETLTPASMEYAANILMEELAAEERGELDPLRFKTLELEHLHKDGSTFWAEVTTSATRDADNVITGLLGVSRDIMERKRLETRIRTARRMEAIGTLAGGVAHDLNNILSGIINYPELLLLDLPEHSPMRGPVETIQKSGEKAAAIVQDLLTLARRGVAPREVLDLNGVVTDFLNSPEFRRLKNFHPGLDVTSDLGPDGLNISGSKVHLFKMVMNLMSNAAEAMPDGGSIEISTRRREEETILDGAGGERSGDFVILSVSDTGVGVAPEDQERIFEPFYTRKKMGRSGTGLGMSVVWGVVQDHDGLIDVKSEVGKGATFTIRFPEVREAASAPGPALSMEDYMGRGEMILVVDDVAEQREIATGILKRLGYSTASAPGGEEAAAYMKTHSADLILLDMIMHPGMDGLATYKEILKLHPGQKAVVASGFSETEQVKKTLEAGAGAYIKKPYLLEKLGVTVRAELDR